MMLLFTAAFCSVLAVAFAEQIDYQPQIDSYTNLFACSYLAKYNLDTHVNKTFSEEEFPRADRLKMFYKMVSHCRDKITLQTSAQLIQSGFDYDEQFATTMGEQVKTLTNYAPLLKNRASLALTEKDKETVELMTEISKNEGERHGKMPTFGRDGKLKDVPPMPTTTTSSAAAERKPTEPSVKKEEPSKKPTERRAPTDQQKVEEELAEALKTAKKAGALTQPSGKKPTPLNEVPNMHEENLSESEDDLVEVASSKKRQSPKATTVVPPSSTTTDMMLEKLLDYRTLAIVGAVVMFIMYQHNQNKHMEYALKMKELEIKAASAHTSPNKTPEGTSTTNDKPEGKKRR